MPILSLKIRDGFEREVSANREFILRETRLLTRDARAKDHVRHLTALAASLILEAIRLFRTAGSRGNEGEQYAD